MSQRTSETGVAARIEGLNWRALEHGLLDQGFARTGPLLRAPECAEIAALFDDVTRFRKRVDMGRHAYGRGHYAYFSNPLPGVVEAMRTALYAGLAPIANRMEEMLETGRAFPPTLAAYRRHCANRGQSRPTPLLLRYETGDFNNLHRDVYGEEFFPLQATCLLSRPGRDFKGGEFLLVENRARQQSRGMVVPLKQGELVVFPGDVRPVEGRRGPARARFRHGVSTVTDGIRTTLGLIFHDAA